MIDRACEGWCFKIAFLCGYCGPGLLWIRLWRNGPGFHIKDWRRHPPLFSDRYGRRLRIFGSWHLKYIKIVPREMRAHA